MSAGETRDCPAYTAVLLSEIQPASPLLSVVPSETCSWGWGCSFLSEATFWTAGTYSSAFVSVYWFHVMQVPPAYLVPESRMKMRVLCYVGWYNTTQQSSAEGQRKHQLPG